MGWHGILGIATNAWWSLNRQATESYTIRLAHILLSTLSPRKPTHILDFCTGTGCIALLLYAILRPSLPVTVTGIDISTTALSLARRNLVHNFPSMSDSTPVRFEHGNILLSGAALEAEAAAARKQRGWWYGDQGADVVTANPPYISQRGFDIDTERSVRNFEPKLALVPSAGDGQQMRPEDVFYPAIVRRAEGLGAKVLLMEVAGTEQAVRVARFVRENARGWWKRIEIWQDVPDGTEILEGEEEKAEDVGFTFRGTGPGRSVVCWRDEPEADPTPTPGERGNLDTGHKL
jgi:HemK-like putative methylase